MTHKRASRDTAGQQSTASWNLLDGLGATLSSPTPDIQRYRAALERGNEDLSRRFDAGEEIASLVHDRAKLVDVLAVQAWRDITGNNDTGPALVAVGGYGRGELHPGSDIDLLILLPANASGDQEQIHQFLTFLWDIGLEPGHSVRNVGECVEASLADITVATALMESRLLAGPIELYEEMLEQTGPNHVWPSRQFFAAKLAEQRKRHNRFHDTAYNLEPNIKSGPGSLRDIQMIGWVARRHFKVGDLQQLVELGFLTAGEFRQLDIGRAYLWKLRYALHRLTGRREDRLLFDHQMQLAREFGYQDGPNNLGVEQFMQRYYRMVMRLGRLNEMLLQHFQEAILLGEDTSPRVINERFQVRNGFLDARNDSVFARQPSALLEVFKILQQQGSVKGVSAATIRLIRKSLHSIDDDFRSDKQNKRLFMDIIRAEAGVTHGLRRMNDYGVLGRYIPAFGRIVGRMQYDLFHAYTVDAHSLFVVSNLRRFALPRFDDEYPDCSAIMQKLEHSEIAYLAGLFHDIAKGREGDHSVLGAEDAEAFCMAHGLGRYHSRLVAWLVRHHLLLSVTAQKKDISDPAIVNDFARRVGDQTHLDYLYLLTVADVRGTNPKLWNSWKASLFREFYTRVGQALRRGLEAPLDRHELIESHQSEARQMLVGQLDDFSATAAWVGLGDDYFLRHSPAELAWHARVMHEAGASAETIVAVGEQALRGGTPLLVVAKDCDDSFARVTATLPDMGFNVVDARLSPSTNWPSGNWPAEETSENKETTLESYSILDYDGRTVSAADRRDELRSRLLKALSATRGTVQVRRKAPRQVRLFATETTLNFRDDKNSRGTIMELIAGDRPGLLSEVAQALQHVNAQVRAAKIMTVGERAEDVFYITAHDGKPLSADDQAYLTDRLSRTLGSH